MKMIQYYHKRDICKVAYFIVGPYKTATSLATKIIETKGYYNPCLLDNPIETAVGLSIPRYKTRESKAVRDLNLRILLDTGCGLSGLTSARTVYCKQSTLLDITDFLYLQKEKIAIKDPLLCWTLPVWISACQLSHYIPKVIFTSRRHHTRTAWQKAPFTKMLLRDSRDILDRMMAIMNQNIKNVKSHKIPYMIMEYECIKKIPQEHIMTGCIF